MRFELQRNAVVAGQRAFTLAEVIISVAIAATCIGSTIYGYVLSARRAEWSAYSLAAESIAMQRIEQTRACKWDNVASPPVDELIATNFPTTTNILDIPISGTNIVYATNFTTISQIQNNPPLRMIRVDCAWRFMGGKVFTNTVVTYRSPDA